MSHPKIFFVDFNTKMFSPRHNKLMGYNEARATINIMSQNEPQ